MKPAPMPEFELMDEEVIHRARSIFSNEGAERANERLVIVDVSGHQAYSLNDFTGKKCLDREGTTPVAACFASGFKVKSITRISDTKALVLFERDNTHVG